MGRAGGQKRSADPAGGSPCARVRLLCVAAPEQGGKMRGEGVAQHAVVVASGRPDVLVGIPRLRCPPRRRGGQPLLVRQEQAQAARERPGPLTTSPPNRGPPHPPPPPPHRIHPP